MARLRGEGCASGPVAGLRDLMAGPRRTAHDGRVLAVLLLAVALAMDATAVAAARSLAVPGAGIREAIITALWFGGFQAAMPLAGWALGASVGPYVEAFDHWIAFGLLVALGLKMLWEARSAPEGPEAREKEPFGARAMLPLAVATSIDALAAGITLPTLEVPPSIAIAAIGVVTALLSGGAVLMARALGDRVGQRLEVFGGLLLMGIGSKILFEHLSA